MQLLVRLHFTDKEEITPEWLCIFIIIFIVEKSHLDRSTQSDTLTCMLKMGKASSKNHGIVCLCGVYMPGGNHLRKSKHKYYYGINSIH